MSEQPGQGDGATGRDTAPRPGTTPGGKGEDAGRLAKRALWLGAGALVLSLFFFPVGLALGVAAIVVAIKARRRASREHTAARGSVPGIVLAAAALALATMQLCVYVMLWPQLSDRQECLSSANTTTDERVCDDRFIGEVERKFGLPKGRLEPYRDMF